MGLFNIKKKAPFEPAVEDLSAIYGVDSTIDPSEFAPVDSEQGGAEAIVRH